MTECNPQIELFSIGRRAVTVLFDGTRITSDAGVLLIKEIDEKLKLTERLASELNDFRDGARVRHTTLDLFRQRTYQICCGYEDCNDGNHLREDPAFQAALGRVPNAAESSLASQPTLSRLEGTVTIAELIRLSETLVELYLDWLGRRKEKPKRIILDFDTTDDPTHGQQQLSFFHGHWDQHMYYPLLVFSDDGWPVAAVLRPGNAGSSKGALGILRRLVRKIRSRFPSMRIVFRADGGFATPAIYEFCERSKIDYVIGQRSHVSWKKRVAKLIEKARALEPGKQRLFGEYHHLARGWSRKRRIVVRAEITNGEDNPRFVVTNLSLAPEKLYAFYIARGESENYIKDLKNALNGDRLSCHQFLSNQFRLLLHVSAYILMFSLREHLQMRCEARVQLDTLRVLLIKVGAKIRVTARRIWVHLSASHPRLDWWAALAPMLSRSSFG